MSKDFSRRDFFRRTVVASAAVSSAGSFEEKTLLAAEGKTKKAPAEPIHGLPAGKIGDLKISRIICGGNLISGFAHSRDLIYVSPLVRQYFTAEKIFETLELCEENGINTIVGNAASAEYLKKYWNERGGKIQWIAQCIAKTKDVTYQARMAVDNGAVGAFMLGDLADSWCLNRRVDLVGKFVDYVKKNGLVAGVAAHNLRVPVDCEKAKVEPDFYMKTFHSSDYWSSRLPENHKDVLAASHKDNFWDKYPEKTREYMKTVKRPWIAYKVLAAGAIHPRSGLRFAFEGGADFACVGMFDFQVIEG